MRGFLKTLGFVFLLCNLFISLDMAVIGSILAPDAKSGYWVMFFPPLFAFLCTLPALFMYSKKELTVKQMIFRRILQIFSTEAIVIGIIKWQNPEMEVLNLVCLGVSILFVFGAVWLINWLRVRSDAKALNNKLKALNQKDKGRL